MIHYNPFADPQTEPPCAQCDCCGDDIYAEDNCYCFDGTVICTCCFVVFARQHFAYARTTGREARRASHI